MAITYTRIGMTDEAIKTYRQALVQDPDASGAHYGLAFLMLHAGRRSDALDHLRAFLASPPNGEEAERHIEHARQTLAELMAEDADAIGGSGDAEAVDAERDVEP
jgi:tetratricopeptide (TPR) repeat protein